MKKLTTLKTLLVGLCAMGAMSAWAQTTTTLLEYGTSDVPWTAEKLAEWTAGGNPTLADGIVTISGGNGSYATSKTITPTAYSIINVTAVWRGASSTGRAFSAGNGSYFRFGNIIVAQNDQDKAHGYGFNGLSGIGSVTTFTAGSYRVDVTSSTWLLIEMQIDTKTNTLTSFKIKSEDGNTTYVTGPNVSFENADYTTVAFGYNKSGSVSTTNKEQLKSIKITQTTQTVQTANYTINYKLGEAIVKAVSSSSAVGNSISAQMAIDGEGDYADNHYLITSEDVPSMVLVAGDNVLNVPVRAPYTGTLNVTTTIGNTEPIVNTINLVESDAKECAWSYAYPLYVKSDNVYYIADNTETFGESGSFTDGEVINKSVSYSNSDESVVFFAEAESNSGTNFVYSNGRSGYVGAQNLRDRGISVGALLAGEYEFIVKITAANRRSLGIRQSTNDHFVSVGTSNEDMSIGIKSASFTLNEETANLFINGANSGDVKTNQSEDFDYVIIKKIIPTAVEKEITSAGYATYCSPYALDFSGVEGLTAYIDKLNGTVVSFTEVNHVPANTGVLLKGAESSYEIPVIASSSTDVSENKLVGVTTSKTVPAGSFVLMNESAGVGFYKANNDFTVSANTAYIEALSDPSRNFIAIDEATAIKAIEKTEQQSGEIYNLAGQRVKSAQKGLYIIGGKKVVIK